MADHVFLGKFGKGQAAHALQDVVRFAQAALLPLGQVDLGDVAGDDGLGADADAGQEHLHLFRRRVLRLVENDEGVVQRPAAHEGERGDLDGALFVELADPVVAHQVVQRVVERAQVRVDLLGQVAGQEAQAFAGFDGRPGQDDALDQIAFEGIDGGSDGEIGLAGAGRADAEGDVVFLDRLQVGDLARRAAVQFGLAGDQLRPVDRAFGLSRDAADRGVDQFDQAELDFIDRQRLARHAVEMADGVGGQPGFFAGNRKALVAPANDDIEAGFDLPDVLVERAAQIGQQNVVDRRQRDFRRFAFRGGSGASRWFYGITLLG